MAFIAEEFILFLGGVGLVAVWLGAARAFVDLGIGVAELDCD